MRSVSPILILFPLACVVILLFGARQARADIINGSFETGNFTDWSRSGFFDPTGSPSAGGPNFATFVAAQAVIPAQPDTNGVVMSQTAAFDGNGPFSSPPAAPTTGRFFAFISNQTNGGDAFLTGSSITQTFSLPTDARTITFDVRLLSNEDPSFFASADDFGGLALTQGPTVLKQFNIDLNSASGADAHVNANVLAGGFFDSSPWLSRSFDVSSLGGQTVTLTAYALNFGGDNFVESRLLLDNIQVQVGPQQPLPAVPVPEPGMFALLACGLLGPMVKRWRGRQVRPGGRRTG